MLSYVIRRILLMFPTLIGMTAVVFFVMGMSPGGIMGSLLSAEGGMKSRDRKALEEYYDKRYGLKKPLVVQYLRWLGKVSPVGPKEKGQGWPKSTSVGFKSPDLGESIAKGRKVSELIGEALPITLLLNALSFPLIYSLSILMGIQAARRRGQLLDVGMGTVMLGLWSVPVIWTGVMLVGFLASKQYMHWFPTNGLHDLRADQMPFLPAFTKAGWERGWLLDTLWHLALPVFCLTYGNFAFLTKLSRGSMLEAISADYVRTARAKGVDEHGVLYRHVFRNSLIPLITVAAYVLPGMLAGSIIVETIFGVPGMGRLMIEAVTLTDRELVLSEALLAGFLGLLAYLLADISYALADPRVSYE